MVDNYSPAQSQESETVAVIGDIVGSRHATDQSKLLATVRANLDWTNKRISAVQDLRPTIGDEFQGVYEELPDALLVTLLIALRLEGDCEVRFGIGLGPITVSETDEETPTQSGPGWWRAREAIDEVAKLQGAKGWPAGMRTRFSSDDTSLTNLVNALLLCRDEIVSRFDDKDARITLGLFLDERQEDLASELEIGQPAVSNRQRHRGAATLFRAHRDLTGQIDRRIS